MMELIELGNECEIITKGTTPTTLGKSFTTIGVGFLRAQNVINSNVLIDEDILYIDDETHNNELKRSQIFNGDVLLTIAGTIGRTAIVKNINIQLNCNQAVAIIRLGDSKINKEYLCHFIASPNAQEQFFKGMVTATIANLSLAQIRKLKIPLPPLPQQQKIANILDAADALRQNDKALIAKYDELTQALFLDMFGDPVSNPKGWEKVELGNITDLITDGKHGNCNDEPNSGYYFISAKDIFDDNINYNRVREIPKTEFEEVDRRTNLQAGDLVMVNTGATIGKLAIAKDIPETRRTTFQKSVAVIKVKREKIDTVFLKYVFILRLESFSGKGSGSAIQNLLLSEMRRFKIIIPPLDLQNQFAERVSVIEEQKAIAQKSLEHSEALFNSLLQKVFKGEL